jgi:23S rRNA (pseudouridine1915-N3)-methyltransferase
LELIALPAAKGALGAGESKAREAKALLALLQPKETLCAMDERGTALDTRGFAQLVQRAQSASRDLLFVVGGDEGLDESVRRAAQAVVSLSAMTLPHRLARLVLVEQLYRAFTVLKGEPYHK